MDDASTVSGWFKIAQTAVSTAGGLVGFASAYWTWRKERKRRKQEAAMFEIFHRLWSSSLQNKGNAIPVPANVEELKILEEMVSRGLLTRDHFGYRINFG